MIGGAAHGQAAIVIRFLPILSDSCQRWSTMCPFVAMVRPIAIPPTNPLKRRATAYRRDSARPRLRYARTKRPKYALIMWVVRRGANGFVQPDGQLQQVQRRPAPVLCPARDRHRTASSGHIGRICGASWSGYSHRPSAVMCGQSDIFTRIPGCAAGFGFALSGLLERVGLGALLCQPVKVRGDPDHLPVNKGARLVFTASSPSLKSSVPSRIA